MELNAATEIVAVSKERGSIENLLFTRAMNNIFTIVQPIFGIKIISGSFNSI